MTAVRVPGAKSVIAGHGPPAMPSCLASLTSRWAAAETPRGKLGIVLLAALHLAALGLLLWSEIGLVPKLALARIVSAGNVAGEGAKIAALSITERAAANAVLDEVDYVELSGRTDFNDLFIDQLAFPG